MGFLLKVTRKHFSGFLVFVLTVILAVELSLVDTSSASSNLNLDNNNNKLEASFNAEDNAKISILVQRADEDGNEGASAANDGPEPGGGKPTSEPTSFYSCHRSSCCYQFTWPGYVPENEIPDPVNNTCDWYKEKMKDDTIACIGSLVYSVADENTRSGRRPNITYLREESKVRDNWDIYCNRTEDKACIKYSFFSNSGDKPVINETRFCGSVTELNSGSRMSSGCHREKVASGVTREVCICSNEFLCNPASFPFPSGPGLFSSIFVSLIFLLSANNLI